MAYRFTERRASGDVSVSEVRAEPDGAGTLTLGGCTFAVRHWILPVRAVAGPNLESRIERLTYAPELRAFVRRSYTGELASEFVARDIATEFVPESEERGTESDPQR